MVWRLSIRVGTLPSTPAGLLRAITLVATSAPVELRSAQSRTERSSSMLCGLGGERLRREHTLVDAHVWLCEIGAAAALVGDGDLRDDDAPRLAAEGEELPELALDEGDPGGARSSRARAGEVDLEALRVQDVWEVVHADSDG